MDLWICGGGGLGGLGFLDLWICGFLDGEGEDWDLWISGFVDLWMGRQGGAEDEQLGLGARGKGGTATPFVREGAQRRP